MSDIELKDFETVGEVGIELDFVFEVLQRYEHIYKEITAIDKLTEDIDGRTMELMTEFDDCDHMNSPSIDTIRFLRRNLKQQIHKFKKYEHALEGVRAEMGKDDQDDKKFGTYEQQVKQTYQDGKL